MHNAPFVTADGIAETSWPWSKKVAPEPRARPPAENPFRGTQGAAAAVAVGSPPEAAQTPRARWQPAATGPPLPDELREQLYPSERRSPPSYNSAAARGGDPAAQRLRRSGSGGGRQAWAEPVPAPAPAPAPVPAAPVSQPGKKKKPLHSLPPVRVPTRTQVPPDDSPSAPPLGSARQATKIALKETHDKNFIRRLYAYHFMFHRSNPDPNAQNPNIPYEYKPGIENEFKEFIHDFTPFVTDITDVRKLLQNGRTKPHVLPLTEKDRSVKSAILSVLYYFGSPQFLVDWENWFKFKLPLGGGHVSDLVKIVVVQLYGIQLDQGGVETIMQKLPANIRTVFNDHLETLQKTEAGAKTPRRSKRRDSKQGGKSAPGSRSPRSPSSSRAAKSQRPHGPQHFPFSVTHDDRTILDNHDLDFIIFIWENHFSWYHNGYKSRNRTSVKLNPETFKTFKIFLMTDTPFELLNPGEIFSKLQANVNPIGYQNLPKFDQSHVDRISRVVKKVTIGVKHHSRLLNHPDYPNFFEMVLDDVLINIPSDGFEIIRNWVREVIEKLYGINNVPVSRPLSFFYDDNVSNVGLEMLTGKLEEIKRRQS